MKIVRRENIRLSDERRFGVSLFEDGMYMITIEGMHTTSTYHFEAGDVKAIVHALEGVGRE